MGFRRVKKKSLHCKRFEIIQVDRWSKMHMHVENLEGAKYKMGKVDGGENKWINGRHQINARRGILVKE